MMWRKRRQSKKPGKVLIKLVLFCFIPLIFILGFFALKFKWLIIKQVVITGIAEGCASDSELKNASGLMGQNFLFVNPLKTTEKIQKKFFCIKSATISKVLPDKIKLQVVSRQPLAALLSLKEKQASVSALIENMATPSAEKIQNSLVVDNEGVIFDKDVNQPDIPKIYVYNLPIFLGEKLNSAQINNALKILEKIKTLGINVNNGYILDNSFVVNARNLSPKAIFKLSDDINIQIASLQLILTEAKINAEDLEFIDLRFDKPVIKSVPKEN